MKAHMHRKPKGSSRVINSQQVAFELKNKVNLALNKLADRDTYQIGADELEKTAECLTPDKISPFLSCISDTDSEQKSAVRKESIRLMATLARFHQGLLVPYISKMVASIVKRLKDPDSVVRDACHETMGVLASKLSNHEDDNDGVFVLLVKPLFEALGEQNKHVQSGAALCLARVIDNTGHPPASILQRMLTRTTKLLKNPHLLAKSSVIELNRSIIQAGGATTQSLLAAAMASIQEALKSSDWTTRKAASIALGEIALSGASFLGSFRASCIRSLESCCFDKVKPVRDTILHALQYWKSVPGPGTSQPSEAGSYVKENFCGGDYSDITSNNDSGWKDIPANKVTSTTNSAIRRMPLSVRKTSQNYVQNPQHCKDDDWHIEISVSEKHNVSLPDVQNEESEGSTVTKTLDGMMPETSSTQDIGYEFVPVDDKQECSSVSNLQSDNFGPKFVTVSHDHIAEGHWRKSMGRNQQFAGEGITNEEEDGVCSGKIRDCRSLDSEVNESSPETISTCCSRMEDKIVGIQKQLLAIDSKQSNLMDLLQVFSTGIMDSMSMLQSKVLSLEHVVQDLKQGGKHPDLVNSKLEKQSEGASFSRLASCTPRPSVDIGSRQPSLLSVKKSDVWKEKALGRNRSPNCAKQGMEIWTNHTVKFCRNPTVKDVHKNSGQGAHDICQIRKNEADSTCSSVPTVSGRQKYTDNKDGLWEHVKSLLCQGDIDSAYAKALSSGDELVLVELLDRTGPVVESLSQKNVYNILSTLASYLLEQRFMNYIIPWLQQVIDLSAIHGPNLLIPSVKARMEILSAIQEAMNMEFSNPAERRTVTQLAIRFHQEWGKCS